MSQSPSGEVTRLLAAAAEGDGSALSELFPIVYHELRRLARSRMAAEPAGHTLEPTALVHEAYLRLLGASGEDEPRWRDRSYFFAAAAEAMRRILVERARRYARHKRGQSPLRVTLSDWPEPQGGGVEELLAIDQALERLAERDAEMAEIAKLRFFAGLTVGETASLLGTSQRSVERRWTAARAFLLRELGPAPEQSPGGAR